MSETRQFIIFFLCLVAAACSFYGSVDAYRARVAAEKITEGR